MRSSLFDGDRVGETVSALSSGPSEHTFKYCEAKILLISMQPAPAKTWVDSINNHHR